MPVGLPAPPPAPSRDKATCGNASSKCAESWDQVPGYGGRLVQQSRSARHSGKCNPGHPRQIQNSVPGRQLLATCEWILHSVRLVLAQTRERGDLHWNWDSTRRRAELLFLLAGD